MTTTAVTTAIKPCIVFNDRCEEAIKLYVSLFPNSKIIDMQLSPADGAIAKGKVMYTTFQLDGREYTAFDGGPTFTFSEGFSLMVQCESQVDIDRYWSALTANGGEEGPCGWLKDPFGLSWQIIPNALGQMLSDSKSGNSGAAMQAMLKMKKLDLAELQKAYRS